MHTETIDYRDGSLACEGYVAYDEAKTGKLPAVLVCHAWAGLGDFEREKCHALAKLGYVGIALDNYGKGKRGTTKEENAALMTPLMEDRGALRKRLLAGFEAAQRHARVDPKKMGAIGFCFGGLCALDLARAGAALCGVVSFHALLTAPGVKNAKITAKILTLHGHDDPMVSRAEVAAFQKELTTAGVDWQLHEYGHTLHAFTNPDANDRAFGTVYEPKADRRSWESMKAFFAEALA